MRPITIIVSFLSVFNLLWETLADPTFHDDVELLEGFENFRYPLQLDLNPEEEDFDRKHLLNHFLTKAIRNKRDAKYKVLESEGLRSHFRVEDFPVEDEDDFDSEFIRVRRSSEVTTLDKDLNTKEPSEEQTTIPELPKPEKLISPNSQYYQDHWTQYDKPRDSEAAATDYNEGIKARAPRVNFITKHQLRNGKSLDVSESRDTKNSILPETTTVNPYQKNLARIFLDYPRPYDTYPRAYEPYVYDNRRNYDDYYDSYMPRTLSYPNFYYYPDKRYDVPRDRYPAPDNTNAGNAPVPYATNEVPPLSPENRNRRIIYYTTLPEIVRARIPLESYLRSFYRYNPSPYNYYNYLTPHILPPVSPYFFVAPVDPYRANRITRDYTKAIGSITQIHDLKNDYTKKNGNNNNSNNNNNGYYNKNSSNNNNNNNNQNNNNNNNNNNNGANKNGRGDKNDQGRPKNGRPGY